MDTGVRFNESKDSYELWLGGKLAETIKKSVYDQKMSETHRRWLLSYKTIISARAFNDSPDIVPEGIIAHERMIASLESNHFK